MNILPVFVLLCHAFKKIAQTGKKICRWKLLPGNAFYFYKKYIFWHAKYVFYYKRYDF